MGDPRKFQIALLDRSTLPLTLSVRRIRKSPNNKILNIE